MAIGVMPASSTEPIYCSKCRKTMAQTNYYTYKDGSKCEICKACLTMHINNFDESTFLWLLEKFDVPYIPAEWNILRDRAYQKDPYKMNGMSVFGKYLSKMKLKQWKNFHWADTEMLQTEAEEKAKLYGLPQEIAEAKKAEMREAYERGEISEAQWMTYQEVQAPEPEFTVVGGNGGTPAEVYPANEHPFEQVDIPDVGLDLTAEDKIYLATKWGRLYTAADWIYLENKYNDFMNSFDIQGAARVDTLIQICKLSLKLNQALDSGDIDSYSKLSRAYDTLMKSAKFTEAQNKEDNAGNFDSIGAIVAFCEKEGHGIPEYEITAPKDIIDTIIEDNKRYLRTLINNDTHLAQQIEDYLKKLEIQKEQKEDRERARLQGLDDVELTNKDYKDFYDSIAEARLHDAEVLNIEDSNQDLPPEEG